MPIREATWRSLYGLFNPRHRLEVDEQDLYVSRPGSVALAVKADLELEPDARWVVCGSMGSGKSSELVQLGRLLWDHHAVVGLDLYQSTAQINEVSSAEVLFLIGAAALQAGLDHWEHRTPPALADRLVRAFQNVIADRSSRIAPGELLKGVALLTANILAPGSTAAAGAVTGAATATASVLPSSLRRGGGPKVGGLTRPLRDGEPDLEAIIDAVNDILLSLASVRPAVVLVDGLDKLTELAAIRGLFSTTRSLARTACPVVYTAPITLMLSTEWQQTGGAFRRERLANVALERPSLDRVQLDPRKLEEGRRALRDVIARRTHKGGVALHDAIEADALDALVLASGGLLRDLIHLVNRSIRAALAHGADRIGAREVEAAQLEIRKEYEVTFNTLRVNELRHVRTHGEPSGGPVSHELLLGGYVLPYANGTVWFEPHPILRGSREGI